MFEYPLATLPQGVPVQPFEHEVAVKDPLKAPLVQVRDSEADAQLDAGVELE